MIVRPETHADRVASIEIERAAFGEPVEAQIVETVRDLPGSIALVADVEGEVVGHVQLSPAHVGVHDVLALGPVGVLPAHQRKGIGTALVAGAIEAARDAGASAVILLGDPAFYGARGFEPAARYGWANPFAGTTEDGFQIEEHDFQVAVLDQQRVTAMAGAVTWHPAFG